MAKAEHLETPRRSERLRKLREDQADASGEPRNNRRPKASITERPSSRVRRKSSTKIDEPPRKKLRTTPAKGRSERKTLIVQEEQPNKPPAWLTRLRKPIPMKPGPEVLRERILNIFKAIDSISDNQSWFSDPKSFTSLPYPSLYDPRNDRFNLTQKDGLQVFPYFGRTNFKSVYDCYRTYADNAIGARRLILYGAVGTGKTICMTALACLLSREKRHVIYVPSCAHLVFDFVRVMKDALYFAIPFDFHSAVDAAKRPEDIVALVGDFEKDYFVFILPDWDEFFLRDDDPKASFKSSSLNWTTSMIQEHYSISSISYSLTNTHDVKSCLDTGDVFNFIGGLDHNEMNHWWKHQSDNLPQGISCNDKADIEDTTGCLPYLLRTLFKFSGQEYAKVKKEFSANKYLSSFRLSVKTSTRRKLEENYVNGTPGVEKFSEHIKACVQETALASSEIQDDIYDHRYFYFVDSVGHCLTGDVRDIAISVMHKHIPTFLDDVSWILATLRAASPFVRKSFLTRICMSRIASYGLQCVDKRLKSMEFSYYSDRPPWGEAIYQSADEVRYLYICETSNSLIDGLILYQDREKKTLDFYAIQIGSTSEDPCLDESFYLQEWEDLRQNLPARMKTNSFTIHTTYVFLYCGLASESLIEERRIARDGKEEVSYKVFKCGFTTLDDDLQRVI